MALFFNIAIAYLIFTSVKTTSGESVLPPFVEVAMKAAPVLSLFMWVVQTHGLGATQAWLASALFFSAVGDVVLEAGVLGMQEQAKATLAGIDLEFFELGALAFAAAHVCYATLLFRSPTINGFAVCMLGVIGAFITLVGTPIIEMAAKEGKDDVVTCYIGFLVLLLGAAVVGTKHKPAALLGATLFAASDAVLAVNKFDGPLLTGGGLPYGKVTIMITYWAAQWLLVQGLI